MRPTDVPDQGLLCDLLWSDPDKDTMGWGENDRGVSFTFGAEVVAKFLHKHDFDLICRAHQVHSHDHDNLSSAVFSCGLYCRWWRTGTSFSPSGSWSLSSPLPTIVASLITQVWQQQSGLSPARLFLLQVFTVILSRCHDVCGRNSDVLLPNLETCRQKEVPLRRPERGQTSDSSKGGHSAESQGEEVRREVERMRIIKFYIETQKKYYFHELSTSSTSIL